ncbi:MAG TPA: type II toxin-antitoxin system RelE/ParE family toxin [Epsilonproteobacteria bacterium]|nr:type II toxin-antitoxin system RelE/ParE family toxin [Campylobacterota bacterium]
MYKIQKTAYFKNWIASLKDPKGKVSITRRIDRIKYGNFGDVKSVGTSISELRITTGPGYRVYFTKFEGRLIILLAGGDKSTQGRDILKANKLLEEIKNERE